MICETTGYSLHISQIYWKAWLGALGGNTCLTVGKRARVREGSGLNGFAPSGFVFSVCSRAIQMSAQPTPSAVGSPHLCRSQFLCPLRLVYISASSFRDFPRSCSRLELDFQCCLRVCVSEVECCTLGGMRAMLGLWSHILHRRSVTLISACSGSSCSVNVRNELCCTNVLKRDHLKCLAR